MNMMSMIELAPTSDDTAVARMGELLWSAIRHGGLLDDRDWDRWLEGVQRSIAICGPLISVELAAVDNDQPARRWFADPITAMLIIRWRSDCPQVPGDARSLDCLAAHMDDDGGGERLAARSRAAWEFRIPGLMLAYASGQVPATSVPQSTWERIVYGPSIPDEFEKPSPPKQARRIKSSSMLAASLQPELKVLRELGKAPRYATGAKAEKLGKRSAAGGLRALPPTADPMRAALRDWAIFALQREKGWVSIGYSPSTIGPYLKMLGEVMQDCDLSLYDAPASALEDHVNAAVKGLNGRAQIDAIKALRSFERFANAQRQDLLEFELDDIVPGQTVAAEIVLPGAFERARASLEKAGDTEACDVLVLMFRAGLRIKEALGLRVGDVSISGSRVELIVEANPERPLKTKTSRRILPLDVLIVGDEMNRLRDRVSRRRSACVKGAEAWLFGPALAISPPDPGSAAKRIGAALRAAAGSERVRHSHLRHSFASYLLATMMLPQDAAEPAVPPALATVISPARFRLVADRLLGEARLGSGALHAVSQLMGHTGPGTTIGSYCHLLDLSLGLYCARPSTLVPIDRAWLVDALGVTLEASRKAGARQRGRTVGDDSSNVVRPTAAAILRHTPEVARKLGDGQLINSGLKRMARGASRTLVAQMIEIEVPRRLAALQARKEIATAPPPPPEREGYRVPWRQIVASDDVNPWADAERRFAPVGGRRLGAGALASAEHAQFVDQRLHLARHLRRDEKTALEIIVRSFRRGRHEMQLSRLGDAEAFVRLLGVMGFATAEIELSLTSRRGYGMTSGDVHRFLADRATARRLAGRGGWRGSLVVRLRPAEIGQPILVARAVRFALTVLAIDTFTTSDLCRRATPAIDPAACPQLDG